MTLQRSGAALPGHPTRQTAVPAAVLPPVYHTPGGKSRVTTQEAVETLLSIIWDEPASVVSCHVGGHGPQYYARSEGHWMPLEHDAAGFVLLVDEEQADYQPYFSLKFAIKRGVL